MLHMTPINYPPVSLKSKTWPMSGSEARVKFVLKEASLLLHMNTKPRLVTPKSTLALLLLKGQGT